MTLAITIIGIILGIFGALSGFAVTREAMIRGFRRWQSRRKHSSQPNDFRYARLELGTRISENGTRWETFRTAKIVSLRDGLTAIDIGVAALNASTETMSVSPNTFKIVPRGKSPTGYTHLELTLDKALDKGATAEFTFCLNFTKDSAAIVDGDKRIWSSNRPVDELLLRVIFTDGFCESVWFKVLDHSDRILEEGQLGMDQISREFRFHVRAPQPNINYGLIWHYKKTDDA